MKCVLSVMCLSILLAGCASTSGIVRTGQDSYLLSKRGATGWSPIESLRVDVLEQAGQFCTSNGKSLNVTNETQSHPPYLLGNFPRVTIEFQCK
jgi:hypothetical protein